MKRGFDRTQRVADAIQKALAQMLLLDDRFRFVTITGVTVSRDLGYAKIYVSVLSEDNKFKPIVDALNRSAKSFRYQLAREVQTRIVPELKFIYDESTAQGFKISSLINKIDK